MRIQLTDITVGKRHRKDLGDIDGLAQSIEEQGLLQPIGITKDRRLVFGERRIAALKLLKRESIEARVVNVTSIIEGECAENEIREDFTIEERVAIGREIEKLIPERRGRPPKKGAKLRQFPPGEKTAEVVAERCGLGGVRTYEKAKAVVEAAEEDAENADLVAEMNRSGKVHGAYKMLQTRQTAGQLESKPLPDPEGRFDVIVIDPPWRYESRAGDPSHRASNPYPDLTIEQIQALPIVDHLEENAIVWLWTTNAFMREAYSVADAWGVKVRTILTWAKHKMGTGDWLRGRTEHCLLCTLGHPTVTLTKQTTMIEGALRQHSRKPEEFYALVRSLCPGTRLEWFARESREGFVAHGPEARKFDAA